MDKLCKVIEMIEDCMYEQTEKGIADVDTEEFGKVADIYKDLVNARYHKIVTDTMIEKSDEYGQTWNENGMIAK